MLKVRDEENSLEQTGIAALAQIEEIQYNDFDRSGDSGEDGCAMQELLSVILLHLEPKGIFYSSKRDVFNGVDEIIEETAMRFRCK